MKGIPQLQLPGYEPLVIPALHVERTNDALDISAQLENVKLAGASKFVLNGLKTSLADHGLQVNVTLPELQFSTNFDVTENVKCELRAKGEVTERKGKKYLQIASMRSDIRVGDAKLNFKSAGDKASPLDTPATAFIRENRGQVLQLVKPLVEDTVNEFIMTVMNRVFQVVPYDTILPA
ncbi:hypothetical protein B566_EDAN001447 [Ephemera danica]|nr:hypothetical protein B566_EDAN001447 [Ephemera danica]